MPVVVCQGKDFLFSAACKECERCQREAAVVLSKWGTTPLYQIPQHIVVAITISIEILGVPRAVLAMKGLL